MTVIDKDGDAFNVGGGVWEVPRVDCGSASDGAMYIQVGPAAMHRGNQGEGHSGVNGGYTGLSEQQSCNDM